MFKKINEFKNKISLFNHGNSQKDESNKQKQNNEVQNISLKTNINMVFNDLHNSQINEKESQQKGKNETKIAILEEQSKQKEKLINELFSKDNIDIQKLKNLAWSGVPVSCRSKVWKVLLNFYPNNHQQFGKIRMQKLLEYQKLLETYISQYLIQEQNKLEENNIQELEAINFDKRYECMSLKNADKILNSSIFSDEDRKIVKIICADVKRTQPDLDIFQNSRISDLLLRVLYLWHFRNPASGYVQGINDIASMFICLFLGDHININNLQSTNVINADQLKQISDSDLSVIESETYYCLCRTLEKVQDFYIQDHPGIQQAISKMGKLLSALSPQLQHHLQKLNINLNQFAFRWLYCLLIREFSMPLAYRLFDTYFAEDNGLNIMHVYVCVAILLKHQKQIINLDFNDLMIFLQDLPTQKWCVEQLELVLQEAYVYQQTFEPTFGQIH